MFRIEPSSWATQNPVTHSRSPLSLLHPNARPQHSFPRFSFTSMTAKGGAFIDYDASKVQATAFESQGVLKETDSAQSSRGRDVKPNRLQKQLQERRKDVFLRKVKQGREDKRWEARSDQILRDDFFARRKEWEESLASSARNEIQIEDGEEYLNVNMDQPATQKNEPAAEIAPEQDDYLDALISAMSQDDNMEFSQSYKTEEYASDEDEMDRLFMEADAQDISGNPKNLEAEGRRPTDDQDVEMG